MNIKPNSLKTQFAQRDPNSEYTDNLTLGELCNYIIKKHHIYVRENIPLLEKTLEIICRVYGKRHTGLFEINKGVVYWFCQGLRYTQSGGGNYIVSKSH